MLTEESIFFLSQRPDCFLRGESMIKIQETPSQHVRLRHLYTSSVGNMDVLPLEILQMIMRELDLRSLTRLKRVSKRGWEIVSSLPEFDNLLRYGYLAMVALGRTNLILWHSVSTIYKTMRSQKCVS
jgi:hypothetical protein